MANVIVILMAGLLAGVLAAIEAARWLGRGLRGGFPKSVECGSARVGALCVFGSISRVTGLFGLKSGTPLGPKRTPLGPPLDPLLTWLGSVAGQSWKALLLQACLPRRPTYDREGDELETKIENMQTNERRPSRALGANGTTRRSAIRGEGRASARGELLPAISFISSILVAIWAARSGVVEQVVEDEGSKIKKNEH